MAMMKMAFGGGFRSRAALGGGGASTVNVGRFDLARRSVDHGVQRFMRLPTKFLACVCIVASSVVAQGAAAQDPPASAPKPRTPPPASDVQPRITIEVTGGEKSTPAENASGYVKFIEEPSLKKEKKL